MSDDIKKYMPPDDYLIPDLVSGDLVLSWKTNPKYLERNRPALKKIDILPKNHDYTIDIKVTPSITDSKDGAVIDIVTEVNKDVCRQIVDLREEATIKALKSLGWLPPKDKEKALDYLEVGLQESKYQIGPSIDLAKSVMKQAKNILKGCA